MHAIPLAEFEACSLAPRAAAPVVLHDGERAVVPRVVADRVAVARRGLEHRPDVGAVPRALSLTLSPMISTLPRPSLQRVASGAVPEGNLQLRQVCPSTGD